MSNSARQHVEALLEAEAIDRATSASTVLQARRAVERGEVELAATLLRDLTSGADIPTAEVIRGDILVRSGDYDEHYELAFRLARSHRLDANARAALAVQTAELALMVSNEALGTELFDFAADLITGDELLVARAIVGRAIADLSSDTRDSIDVARCVGLQFSTPVRLLCSVAECVNRGRADGCPNELGDLARGLETEGLIDLGRRVRVIAVTLDRGPVDPAIGVDMVANCPWVTTVMLHRRFENCPDADFDYWATVLDIRAAAGPHPSLVNETSDVIKWATEIYDQQQQNVRLSLAVEQTQSGWRELANLTSNEIRGLLTSLSVVTDLRRTGPEPPPGLELALVRRIAALTTMTQFGASEPSNESNLLIEERVPAAGLIDELIEGERPVFDWTRRSLVVNNLLASSVTVDVHPASLSDMLRWLLLGATSGSLALASIEIEARLSDGRVVIEIRARTPESPLPEPHRELGLGEQTTAYRAADVLIDSWGGRFSAVYSDSGLDVLVELPAATM